MRKLIIIAGGLTLLALGFAFWAPALVAPSLRGYLSEVTASHSLSFTPATSDEKAATAKAAADTEAKRKAEEAEQQQLAAAKAEEERQAKAAADAGAQRRGLRREYRPQVEFHARRELQRSFGLNFEESGRDLFATRDVPQGYAHDAHAPRDRDEEVERRRSVPERRELERLPKGKIVLDAPKKQQNRRQQTEVPLPAERPAEAPALGAHEMKDDNEIGKMERARQELERLPKGKIVLDAPKDMKVGDTRAVYANVGINVPIELLQKHSRPTDQSHEAVLSVSSEMAATLTGPGFAITPTTPEQQGVAEGFPTIWSWNVEAKQEGEQELEATLYVLLPVSGKSTRQRIDSYTHKIGVAVKEQSWAEWLKSSKEQVEAVHVIAITLGSAAMAVFGWLGLSYSRRRNQAEAT